MQSYYKLESIIGLDKVIMNTEIELLKENRPYEIKPIEGKYCSISGCHSSSVSDKNSCNYHACPYSNDGDDGYF